jgi:tetratricopeptide (TPR) repeat protein
MKRSLSIVAAAWLALAALAAPAHRPAETQEHSAPPVVATESVPPADNESERRSRQEYLVELLAPGELLNPTEVTVEAAQAGVRAHPRDADAWHQLGESLEVAGRLDEAVQAYDRAAHLPPRILGRGYLYRDLAAAREKAGDITGALAAARVSLRSWPLSRDVLYCTSAEAILMTRLLVKSGDLRGAADFYLPLWRASPNREYCPDIERELIDAGSN